MVSVDRVKDDRNIYLLKTEIEDRSAVIVPDDSVRFKTSREARNNISNVVTRVNEPMFTLSTHATGYDVMSERAKLLRKPVLIKNEYLHRE
jgi:hypothetical protein